MDWFKGNIGKSGKFGRPLKKKHGKIHGFRAKIFPSTDPLPHGANSDMITALPVFDFFN